MAIYYYVPDGGTSFGASAGIPFVLGAVFGGYHQITHGGGLGEAAGVTAGTVVAMFRVAGDYVANLAPSSSVLLAVGWFIKWILGIYFAIFAGAGGFVGAGVVWILADLLHAVSHSV